MLMKRLNIALISEHASPLAAITGIDNGGQNVYVNAIARELALAGHYVDVFTRKDQEDLEEEVLVDGFRVVHVPAGPSRAIPKEELLPYMPEFRDWMVRYIERKTLRYDVTHANFFMSGWVSSELKAKLEIPFAVTFHALGKIRRLHQGESDGFSDDRFGIEAQVIRDADTIIGECPQDVDDLILHYDADPNRIALIPCGVDLSEFQPVDREIARQRIGLSPQQRCFLQLGRIVPRKGIDTAIRAFGLFAEGHRHRDRHGQPVLLVVGGASPDPSIDPSGEMRRLRDVARYAGVGDLVHFVGAKTRETLKYYYSAADALLTLPWYEPFGITPLESMACACPVIGSRVGGIRYTVLDRETGLLVEPRDESAAARSLAEIFMDVPFRNEMGRNGRMRVEKSFTWKRITRQILQIYQTTVDADQFKQAA